MNSIALFSREDASPCSSRHAHTRTHAHMPSQVFVILALPVCTETVTGRKKRMSQNAPVVATFQNK